MRSRLDAWLRAAAEALRSAGIDRPEAEVALLAAHGLGRDRTWVLTHPEAEVDTTELGALLDRRVRREPLAYIVGEREFWGRRFAVGPGVLIPRPETETLVDVALELGDEPRVVVDFGTGSGCLAITLKLERPQWRVLGLDVSPQALDCARRNGLALGADVDWVLADGLRGLAPRGVDLLVTNPPYIALEEPLAPEIADWEPHGALYAGGDGLAMVRRIAREGRVALSKDGRVVVELAAGREKEVRTEFEAVGWRALGSRADLAGIPRALTLL